MLQRASLSDGFAAAHRFAHIGGVVGLSWGHGGGVVAVDNALAAVAESLRRVADALDAIAAQPVAPVPPAVPPAVVSWRERLWTCDPQVRVGVPELSEATGRPKSWAYRAARGTGTCPPVPHRKLDGHLVFVVGEVRQWLREHEQVEVPGRTAPLVVGRGRP